MSSIAVFDSGFGGLTVLKQLQRRMPEEDYIFYGDSANAPYGDKSPEELRKLTTEVCRQILAKDAVKCFVIACNTTTSEALGALQETFPDQRFVGIEPAVREAVRRHPGGKILVLGTTATIRGRRLQGQLEELEGQAEIALCAATGIVPFVEGQQPDREAFLAYLGEEMAPYREGTEAVVLGCTHFPFVKRELQAQFAREVRFYDAAVRVAEETEALLRREGMRKSSADDDMCETRSAGAEYVYPGSGIAQEATYGKAGNTPNGNVIFMNSDPAKIEQEKEMLDAYECE